MKSCIEPCIPVSYAAKILGVSIYTVRRYLKDGTLKGTKLPSGHWRTTEAACAELLQRRSNA